MLEQMRLKTFRHLLTLNTDNGATEASQAGTDANSSSITSVRGLDADDKRKQVLMG